ncbi:OsmC family protein [Pontibacter sp. G13]|uniref:OsmC family protein n=1 Tax=Pontibacter sp. G13 TaxID=3074898 RepID=UPI00288B4235|nr:OsmC family protein [Pontibacter sp. G13]WNJ16397.1 OsmC family protein [Pontibacter sp. G13]
MKTSHITYQGNLRTSATHLRSENTIITDAPTDNHGKGEAFSPTDLLATSIASCMITIMGIQSEKNDLEMGEVTAEVEKIMASNPRRVAAVNILLNFENHNLSDTDKSLLENAALNCPVCCSLHPDLKVHVKFQYI